MPPPMNAPAALTAESLTAMSVSLLGWAPVPRRSGYLCCARARVGSVRWFGLGRRLLVGRGLVLVVLVVLVVVVMLVMASVVATGHPEVQDRQQREDEGLEAAEEHRVEQLPDHVEHAGQDPADGDVGRGTADQSAD